jgi:hypothetical protein
LPDDFNVVAEGGYYALQERYRKFHQQNLFMDIQFEMLVKQLSHFFQHISKMKVAEVGKESFIKCKKNLPDAAPIVNAGGFANIYKLAADPKAELVKLIVENLKATGGKTEFSHIPDWFEFQKANVRKQIEDGTYYFEDEVSIESLPNADGYISLGKGKLKHDINGFVLEGMENNEKLELIKEPLSMYGLHIEYDYFKKGDCIDLSTHKDTYYIYPLNKKNVVTKLHFAVEEIYKIKHDLLIKGIKKI